MTRQYLHEPGLSSVMSGRRKAWKAAPVRQPRKPKRELEGKLENHCVKEAFRRKGWLSRKMNGLGFNHWPDRQFLGPKQPKRAAVKRGGVWCDVKPTLWVEFKRLGEKPTKAQRDMHRDLRARGQRVEVIDNREAFYKLLEEVVL